MTENPSKYPWLDIVRFHKDFVNLEQDIFFKIRLGINGQPDPSKCLALGNCVPDSINDAWEIPCETYQKERIFEEIKRGNISEGFLGGPCWSGVTKDENQRWVSYISPFFYQHVRVEYNDEKKTLLIVPDEGRWEIPSVTYNEINKKEYSPDIPPEELPFKILENAHLNAEKNQKTLSENIIAEIITRIPPFQELFKTTSPNNGKKNSWIFFVSPSSEKSAYSQHLLPDYETLEQRLKDNPADIGGLRVLESHLNPVPESESNTTIYPLIPLNPSQEMAVKGILDEKPITVISGPPGCGKSQVVVSLLLNAWAQGKSVLFASNTKAAVDVVYDRLKEYECDYPIAIRAGSKERSTIKTSLEKLQYLTVQKNNERFSRDSTQREIADLFRKKQDFQTFLDNKIPQRITQAKQTASRSFLDLVAVTGEISSNIDGYQKQVAIAGYAGIPVAQFEEDVVIPLRKWWDAIEITRNTIKNDESLRQEYSQKIIARERDRDAVLSRTGFDVQSGQSYSWLVHGVSPVQFEQWLKKYRELLSDDIERYYSSNLNDTHKKWNSESDARKWLELSEELLNKINNLVTINKEKYAKYTELKTRHDTFRNEIIAANLSPDVPFDKKILVQWKQEYSHFLSIPDGLLSLLKKRSSESGLQQIEQTFQSYYPPEVWAAFSRDRNAGRKALSSLIDLTIRWMDLHEVWENFGSDRLLIERECADIEQMRRTLQLQKFILNYREDLSFIEISQQIRGLESTAQEAADTWCLYAKKERLLADLRTLALQLDSFIINSPIVKVWADRQGLEFTHIIKELKSQPTFELIAKSWNYCSSDRYASFIDDWNACRNFQKEIEEYTNHFQQVPPVKSRIADWWGQVPAHCAIKKTDQSALPTDGDVLHRHILECEELCKRWRDNSQTVLKDLDGQKKEHFKRILQNLQASYDAIPQSMRNEKIDAVYAPLLHQSIDDRKWIRDDDEELFNQFNPERIQASINQVNSRLADLSFTLAKDGYLKRISNEAYVLEDADALRNHFKETYQNARGFPRKKYENALKAIPVWVANAHNTKSFPLEPEIFDILVIDEASQCSLTNLLPLIYRAKSLAIIGDPNQLSAIFKGASKGKEQALAIKHGVSEYLDLLGHLDNTMFELGLKILPGGRKNMINLVEHYRSHPLVIGFSNLYIYQMRLSLRKASGPGNSKDTAAGVFGVNITGECARGDKGKSWVNVKEAKMISDLVSDLQNSETLSGKSIGIVTPFSSQREMIEKLLQEQYYSSKELLIGNHSNVLVGTVDTFQGNERDIMIFSPVISRNMQPNTARWSDDKNRINVALTRARDLMIVVGDFEYCRKMDSILGKLIEYIEMITVLRETSYAELELFSLMIMEGNDLKISRANLPKIHQRIGRLEVDFVLHNPEKGVHLVVEVDGKQHYYVEINGSKYPVKYEGFRRYIEINNEKHFFHLVGKQEFVGVNGENYPVIQTPESIYDDKGRDALLRSEGYKIHRIHVRDIYDKPAVVMNDIKEKLEIG